jgi:predicted DNA-binding transcriptional regulator AlpA
MVSDNVMMTSRQVADRLNVSIRTLWRLIAQGRFPPGIKYSRKLVRWTSKMINEWMVEQEEKHTAQYSGE